MRCRRWSRRASTASCANPSPPSKTRTPPTAMLTGPCSADSDERSAGERDSAIGSARRHADGAVQADRLAVEHRVLDDLRRELRELLGAAEARREGDLLAELRPRLLGQRRQERRVEQARRDGDDADAVLRE